jgi:hypothetical protein
MSMANIDDGHSNGADDDDFDANGSMMTWR